MGDLLGNAVRFGVARRRDGGRRRHRDHAVAALRPARPCRWRRRSRPAISPPSCFPRRCAGSTSSATTIRPAMARATALIERAQRCRDRGDRPVAAAGRLQRGSAQLRPRCAASSVADPTRTGGRRPLHASARHSRREARSAAIDVDRSVTASANAGESRDHGLREGDRPASGPARQWRRPAIFRRARVTTGAPFHREAK